MDSAENSEQIMNILTIFKNEVKYIELRKKKMILK
jgi:hypothetical protein